MISLNRSVSTRHVIRLLPLIGVALLAACAAPSADEQDKNWNSATDLIETSDRILITRFADSREENIQLIDSVTGAIAGETDVLFRQFELFETLKGTSDAGDLLWVAFETGSAGELFNGAGSVVRFEESETYVLFLKGRLRPLEYPTEYGAVLWTENGQPAIAELVGDRLEFRSGQGYLDALQREGATLPEPQSAAPFALTLDALREATD